MASQKDTEQSDVGKTQGHHRIRYSEKPDYTRPVLDLPDEARERIFDRLRFLYGYDAAQACMPELERLLKVHYAHKPLELIEQDRHFDPETRFSETDMVMITYGDLLRGKKHSPLASLAYFLQRPLKEIINTIHILPFFPYSSDRGFSITDFKSVDPKLGSWTDIYEIGKDFKLLFDGVLNHASSESEAFQEFLNDHPRFRDVVIAYSSPEALTPEQRSLIRRPRTSDILTRFDSLNGPVYVWTTFSPDQIDLNYRNPRVLMFAIGVLLLYIRHGADIIRLDAVTYLWEELGTDCASLKQTHAIIKLFRDILDLVAPRVALLTETNVPHEENVSYFGDGHDEAQMVYNFALPALVLYSFYTEDATTLCKWARNLVYPSKTTTFFNILDTHDGIGLQGVKNILSGREIDFIVEKATREHEAFVGYKSAADGTEEPYEINSTWYGALNNEKSGEKLTYQVRRFIASRSIAMALKGVPAIYLHGMAGTGNDPELVEKTGVKRDINRTVIDEEELDRALKDPASKLSHIRRHLRQLGLLRVGNRAFHPNGEQKVLMLSPSVFSILRISPEGDRHILALTSVSNKACHVDVALSELGIQEQHWYDLFGDEKYQAKNDKIVIPLKPYDVAWLQPASERRQP
jgi:sucrose phosphorylase